ncbi:uncharacterized protein MYCFIDRAFT_177539 [Pseudocercospora fijiensis CIRAD86]|uniref:F-box domain-containing protein n=1 Tax=Pseudocercospora fijiensis (strain CIRAD86) TaxID=383855 RepID=M3ATY3_PSEFD|nr:uncharacterized protein MYCFIDRAFT_177539 [Pseudocercospora fijiensis CIRAD86]EME80608.1 hypothetical protein MYCFIDRAFT_177539 [Pseudocercospora fijiensis CIRAD86]
MIALCRSQHQYSARVTSFALETSHARQETGIINKPPFKTTQGTTFLSPTHSRNHSSSFAGIHHCKAFGQLAIATNGLIAAQAHNRFLPLTETMNPEQNFVDNYNGTKATEALQVVELAEHILSFLDIRPIIKTTRVCKQLRDTLATSSKLRTLTYLAPEPQHATFEELVARNQNDFDRNPLPSFSGIAINPLVFEDAFRDSRNRCIAAAIIDTKVLFLPPYSDIMDYDYLQIDEGEQHSCLDINRYIEDAAVTKAIAETPGSARHMLLAYQPSQKDIEITLDLDIRENRSCLDVRAGVTVSGKIPLGGLCDVLNLLWTCLRDPGVLREETKDGFTVAQEHLRGKAGELGRRCEVQDEVGELRTRGFEAGRRYRLRNEMERQSVQQYDYLLNGSFLLLNVAPAVDQNACIKKKQKSGSTSRKIQLIVIVSRMRHDVGVRCVMSLILLQKPSLHVNARRCRLFWALDLPCELL